ncbi:MAG: hypothetical protein ABDH66_04685 [Bacteroidia bacterium]
MRFPLNRPSHWILLALLSTIAYWPITLNKRDFLYRDPELLQHCQQNPYCRHNLLFFPIQLVAEHGDTWSYIYPIEYLFKQGVYWDDYRTPGYGAPYAVFRLITGSPEVSLWLLALLQVILWAASIGLMLFYLQRRGVPTAWLIGLNFLLCFSPLAYHTRILGTETLTAALTILGTLLLFQRQFFLAGIAFTWVFFLRPLNGIYVPLIGVWIIYTERKLLSKSLAYFALPFILLEGAWIGRNFLFHGDFRPFFGSKSLNYPFLLARSDIYVLRYAYAIGEGEISKRSEAGNIHNILTCHSFTPASLEGIRQAVPAWAFGEGCTPESLQKAAVLGCELAHSITYSIDPPESLYYGKVYKNLEYVVMHFAPTPEDCEKELKMVQLLDRCIKCAKKNSGSIDIWVQKWLKMLGSIAYRPGFSDKIMNPKRLLVKKVYYYIYFLATLAAILSAVFMLFQSREGRLVAVLYLAPILAHLVLGYLERRYVDLLFSVGGLEIGLFLAWLRSGKVGRA